jgi:hypothetical protein
MTVLLVFASYCLVLSVEGCWEIVYTKGNVELLIKIDWSIYNVFINKCAFVV